MGIKVCTSWGKLDTSRDYMHPLLAKTLKEVADLLSLYRPGLEEPGASPAICCFNCSLLLAHPERRGSYRSLLSYRS